MKYSPEEVNLLICDLAGDLLQFDGFPHLSYPIIQDFDTFLHVILEVRDKMEQRIKMKGTKRYSRLPRLVIASDEFTSFISGTDAKNKLAREAVTEILRRGRHAKISFIAAAHNPTQQRLGLDIADIPTKLAFRVARQCNSLAILSQGGAERLAGNGDMLFQSSQCDEPQRIQGADIGPKTLKYLLSYIRQELSGKTFNLRHKFVINQADLTREEPVAIYFAPGKPSVDKRDIDIKRFAQVLVWVLGHDYISVNMITESFNVGWRRANEYIKRLHDMGIVGVLDAKLPRQVLPDSCEALSAETVTFLNRYGYSDDQIRGAFDPL
jgi:DNA segregation ATPase FtsK/SpoIIIE-like protein